MVPCPGVMSDRQLALKARGPGQVARCGRNSKLTHPLLHQPGLAS